MDAQNARKASNNEIYKIVLGMIDDATKNGETEIDLTYSWVTGIENRLRAGGYRLRKWSGEMGDYDGTWMEIAW